MSLSLLLGSVVTGSGDRVEAGGAINNGGVAVGGAMGGVVGVGGVCVQGVMS